MQDKKPPCYGCADRRMGCHSECERYKTWLNEMHEEKQKLTNMRYEENITANYVKQNLRKIRKRQRERG